MSRAVSNSALQIGLFTIPIALHKLADPKEVTFDRATAEGDALKRVEVAAPNPAAVTAAFSQVEESEAKVEAVERAAIVYGVRDEDGNFHKIDAEAIKEIEAATKLTTFEVDDFIPFKDVPWERGLTTYYVTPQGKAGPGGITPQAILHKALMKTKTAAVTKICLTKRQYLAVVYAKRKGLYVQTLAWSEDWAQADDANVLEGVKVEQRMVDVAVELIRAKMADDPIAALDRQIDDLRVARARLRDEALADKPFKARKKKAQKKAPDGLLAALEESLRAVNAA